MNKGRNRACINIGLTCPPLTKLRFNDLATNVTFSTGTIVFPAKD